MIDGGMPSATNQLRSLQRRATSVRSVPPPLDAVSADLPFPFAMHLQACAVDDHAGRTADRRRGNRFVQLPGPLDRARVMRNRHLGAHQFRQCPAQAFAPSDEKQIPFRAFYEKTGVSFSKADLGRT